MPNGVGRLVLVVGPSGAGKDSVLRGAASTLSGDARYFFPRRLITREADTNSEDHDTITEADYRARIGTKAFMLHWEAHGLCYAIPRSVEDEIKAGRIASINVSRNILHETAASFPGLIVVEISADPEIRISRIQSRGREEKSDAVARALRETAQLPSQIAKFYIENNGTVEQAIAQFVTILEGL